MTKEQIQQTIRSKVVEVAAQMGNDAAALTDDEVLTQTGYLDSAGLMGLIAWYEMTFNLDIPQEDLTIDKLGSLSQMADYALQHVE